MELRIQKYIADCGIMSRRSAEKEIELGNIKINGICAVLGQKIDPRRDTVMFKGKKIVDNIAHKSYVMLNKPRGYVSTLSDEQDRKCIKELIEGVKERVYPVGRLDMNSEGLLLLTNDGELTNVLTHPKNEVPKVYLVRICGSIDAEKLRSLSSPMEIDGYRIKPVKIVKIRENENTTLLRFELREGRNRQIRKMCELNDIGIASLKRICEGEIQLGDLPTGKWRYLTRDEIKYLTGIGREPTENENILRGKKCIR